MIIGNFSYRTPLFETRRQNILHNAYVNRSIYRLLENNSQLCNDANTQDRSLTTRKQCNDIYHSVRMSYATFGRVGSESSISLKLRFFSRLLLWPRHIQTDRHSRWNAPSNSVCSFLFYSIVVHTAQNFCKFKLCIVCYLSTPRFTFFLYTSRPTRRFHLHHITVWWMGGRIWVHLQVPWKIWENEFLKST